MKPSEQMGPECVHGLKLLKYSEQELKKDLKFFSPFYNQLRLNGVSPSQKEKKFYVISQPENVILQKLSSHVKYKKIVNTSEALVFPGVQELAKSGYSERTIRRAIKSLTEKGWLVKISPDKKKTPSNQYLFTTKIKSLADLTRALEAKKKVSKDLKIQLVKEPDLQETLFEKSGLLASELRKVKELMLSLFEALEKGHIEVSDFVPANRRLLNQEKILRKQNKNVTPIVTKGQPQKEANGTHTVTHDHPHRDPLSPEILNTKYSYEILTNKITTTNTKPDEKTSTQKVSSSLLNYFSSLGFKFTRKHLKEKLPQHLEESSEELLIKKIHGLKNYLNGQGMWQTFVHTTFSVNRVFENSKQISHGLKGVCDELFDRAGKGILLEYANFKILFKTEKEAVNAIFPNFLRDEERGQEQAKKEKALEPSEDSEKQLKQRILNIKNDLIMSGSRDLFDSDIAEKCALEIKKRLDRGETFFSNLGFYREYLEKYKQSCDGGEK